MRKLSHWLPQTLKHRLFLAFVALILLPFGALSIYNFQQIESLMQEKISMQSYEQLQRTIRSLEDLMSIAFKTSILLEQDKTVEQLLKTPEIRSRLRINTSWTISSSASTTVFFYIRRLFIIRLSIFMKMYTLPTCQRRS